VETPHRASLRAAVNADVAEVPTAEGRQLSAGEPLVILDDREIELVLRQRQADLAEIEALIDSERQRHQSDLAALKRERVLPELAEQAVARAQDLYQRNLGSQSLLDEARQAP
jgi:multidrug resistance efflux pump